MIVIKDTYGSDIDGHRGIEVYEYEIDNNDQDEKENILEQIYESFLSGNDSGKEIVSLWCDKTDREVELEVDIEDYIPELVEMAINDDLLYDDDELQEWLKSINIVNN